MRQMAHALSPCKDYERRWKQHCVDKGLEDNWLEALNSLEFFNLVSICEGHDKSRGVSFTTPGINIRTKMFGGITMKLESYKMMLDTIRQLLPQFFPTDMFMVGIHLNFRMRIITDDHINGEIIIDIKASQRDTQLHSEEKNFWFETAVKNIQSFDQRWGEYIEPLIADG